MATLTTLAPFVPLMQTLLWVLLVLFLVVWFRKSLSSLLLVIQQRIEAGSSIKAGPFELLELVKPQSPDQQRQRASAEIAEAVQEASTSLSTPQPSIESNKSSYFQAEDLALRALQAEYGVPIQRSVVIGPSREVDGVFIKDRRLYVVEVKFNLGPVSEDRIRMSVRRAQDAAFQLAGTSGGIALVLVFKREEDVAKNEARVRRMLKDHKMRVDLWMYSLPKLLEKFGAKPSD